MQFPQLRPVQALPVMMRRVITEIPGQQVEEPVAVVVRGMKCNIGIQTIVMIIGHPGCKQQADDHRKQKYEYRRYCSKPAEQGNPGKRYSRVKQKFALRPGMFPANLKSPIISRASNNERVFHRTHRASVRPLPATFVLRLVQKILMMTEYMVQNPQICGHPGVQCVEKFEQAVGREM